jgi:hypothetical protein
LRSGVQVAGRLLAAPMRRGEPLTDVRLLEPTLLAALPDADLVAVPVRIVDGSAAALVRAGDVVDVLAASDVTGTATRATTVATGLRVLAVPGQIRSSGDGAGLVVVASTRVQATALAQASGGRLSLVVEHP